MDSKCKDITRNKGTMTVEYNFHSRDGKPKPKEPPKQEIDQTSTTPKEKFIVGALLIVVVGYLVLSILDIILLLQSNI